MNTLDYISKKYKLDLTAKSPIEIPNIGRNNLPEWLHELDFKVGVEVGVAAGEYSEIICKANPQMRIYGVDPWQPYKGYTDYTGKGTLDKLYQEATDRFTKYPNFKFVREFSMDALKRFEDKSLDFVYIDANHRDPYVTQDVEEWSRKVKPGGILSGHDYKYVLQEGFDIGWKVKDAVNKYTRDHNIKPWFLLGLKNKMPGMIRDENRSWMIIMT